MLRRIIALFLFLTIALSGCSRSPAEEVVSAESLKNVPVILEENLTIKDLHFETAKPPELGNSIFNLRHLGLVAGDSNQLYTLEYWPQDLDGNQEGMQIYVSDVAGRRCLTNEDNIVGYLNLTDSALYYVNGRGIVKIDRGSEITKQVVSAGEISFLLAVGNKLYFINGNTLYSYDVETKSKKRITSPVEAGYLDYEEGTIYYCTAIDRYEGSASLCAVRPDGSVKTIYCYNAKQSGPIKVIDSDTFVFEIKVQDYPPAEQRELALINLREKTQKTILTDYRHYGIMGNGKQLVAGVGRNDNQAWWLIDLNREAKGKLPDWNGGALNFVADRLFAVNVVNVTVEELTIKNDQFYSTLMP